MKNNTIALMTGILIIISIAVIVSPRPLFYLSTLTGHSTENSTITLNLTQETSILVTGAVNFGTGNVYSNASFAILDSSAATGGGPLTVTLEWDNITGISGDDPAAINKTYAGITYIPPIQPKLGWKNVTGISNSPLSEFPGVYDTNRQVFLFYGYPNETWKFNYSNLQWTNITSSVGSSPYPNADFGIAFASSTGETIIFGGAYANDTDWIYLNETWKFNSSGVWQNMSPSGGIPAIQTPMMSFDSKRNVVVLFGGTRYVSETDTYVWSEQTWEYNLSSNEWARKVDGPSFLHGKMVFDSNRNVSVFFAGEYNDGVEFDYYINETWEYDGTSWTNVTGSITGAPSVRNNFGMAYDSARKKILLAGGYDSIGYFNETWEYDGNSWTDTGRSLTYPWEPGSMLFDPDVNETFTFFGYVQSVGFTNDVNKYGYSTPKYGDVFLMYGGFGLPGEEATLPFTDTFIFNYSNNKWTNLTDLTYNPQGAVAYGSTFDSSIPGVLLFGGTDWDPDRCDYIYNNNFWDFHVFPDTWLFDGSDWDSIAPEASPPKLIFPSMVFDSKRNVTVLYGGYGEPFCTPSTDTWEFDYKTNNWTNTSKELTPPSFGETPSYSNPPNKHLGRGAMAFDSDRGVVVAVLGFSSASCITEYQCIDYTGETWEYNGSDWVNVTSLISGSPPLHVTAQGMVYDPLRKVIVLAGGLYTYGIAEDYSMNPVNETWEYNGTAWTQSLNFSGAAQGYNHLVFDSQINQTFLFFGDVFANDSSGFPVAGNSLTDVQMYNVTIIGGGEGGDGGGCINGTWSFGPSFIYVENDGTVNISIDYTANKAAGTFIGGTSPSFKIKGVVDEAGACPDLNTTYTEVSSSTPNEICPVLKYENNADRFKIPSRLIVPADVSPGEHNSTITLSATQVGGPV